MSFKLRPIQALNIREAVGCAPNAYAVGSITLEPKACEMKFLVIHRLKPSATGAEILKVARDHATYLKRLESEDKLERYYLIWAPSRAPSSHPYCDIEVYEARSRKEVESLLKKSPISPIADYEILQVLTWDESASRGL